MNLKNTQQTSKLGTPKATKDSANPVIIALAGNPNVGKSTVFNSLTGMHQHTGNWPGKTVGNARGFYTYKNKTYALIDIPGTYSLISHSAEEEIARDFLCFGNSDATVIVCDATCLQRNLNLVLQTMEVTNNVILCVNLMDEAERKQIHVDCRSLAKRLGVPVIPTCARQGKGLQTLMEEIHRHTEKKKTNDSFKIAYRPEIEAAIKMVEPYITYKKINSRWTALKLIEGDEALCTTLKMHLGIDFFPHELTEAINAAKASLSEQGYDTPTLRDAIVADIFKCAEAIYRKTVSAETTVYNNRQLKIDRLLTGKFTGIPIMVILLLCILWLTVTGANYPSALLSELLFGLIEPLDKICASIGMPSWLQGALIDGVYRVLAWVVSVMLPPMAIFFPLFTLLEDLGYLPRVAFNLDRCFKKCRACGKQALTMCMGFGCNAVGVIGCRIIDSPRERLIALLTNCFVPCNGRFPTLISIITMFFVAGSTAYMSSALSALLLTAVILLGIGMTFVCSRFLSATALKGIPSSFTLELPPYRRPQVGRVLLRSVFDRTLFVLGRAACVAAPAGLLIYIMANVTIGSASLLSHCAGFLDPFARCIGLDGIILMAFILGFPANEIVMPIAIMAYMSGSTLVEMSNLESLRNLLITNGWTPLTAACTMIFSLLHWPCSTTLISIKKETGSWCWTALGFILPTAIGMLICFLLTVIVRCFSCL